MSTIRAKDQYRSPLDYQGQFASVQPKNVPFRQIQLDILTLHSVLDVRDVHHILK